MDAGKALVTGAGKRLGRAMALYLAQRGFDVAVHYAGSEAQAQGVVAEIHDMGRQAVALQADLLDEAQTATVVSRAMDALGGPLTVLVNNASIFEDDDLRDMTRASWDRHIESNLRAPVLLTQDFARHAPKAGRDAAGEPLPRAVVVNMLDQRVRNLRADHMSYTVGKMGLWAFTQTAARALAPDVRVNAIGPGPTLQGAHQTAEGFVAERHGTLLGRGANLSDITHALGYFLDADAVTGQLLCVDGGQHLT